MYGASGFKAGNRLLAPSIRSRVCARDSGNHSYGNHDNLLWRRVLFSFISVVETREKIRVTCVRDKTIQIDSIFDVFDRSS